MVPFQAVIMRDPQVPGFPFTPFTVPVGKRLVIEYVSGNLNAVPSCNTAPRMELRTSVGGTTVNHYFSPENTGIVDELNGSGPERSYVLSRETRLYADPGSQVLAILHLSASPGCGYTTGDFGLHVSGYLVDIP
jgi:hypothetical protein